MELIKLRKFYMPNAPKGKFKRIKKNSDEIK